MIMLPVMLRMEGKRVLVVGGGPVGQRKALTVIRAGAFVDLLALESKPQEFANNRVNWIVEPYSARYLEGKSLVFAAATPEINAQICRDAGAMGIWVNSATADGNLILPACVHRGSLTIAVSTSGASPAFARQVRDRLEQEFDESFDSFVRILVGLREQVLEHVDDPCIRRQLLEELGDWHWLEFLRKHGEEAVTSAMHAVVRSRCD